MKIKDMKRKLMILSLALMILVFTGCGKKDDTGKGQDTQESSSQPERTQEPETGSEEASQAGSVTEGHDYAEGWTEEMQTLRMAITGELGEDYWPDMAVTPELLESQFGLKPDMYEDYMAEVPLMSVKVDSLIVVKAKAGKADDVEELLNAYRDNNVNNTMQYPMNVGKVQASKVERIGDYVCFAQLGGDVTEAAEDGDEAIIRQCLTANDQVLDIIRQQVG